MSEKQARSWPRKRSSNATTRRASGRALTAPATFRPRAPASVASLQLPCDMANNVAQTKDAWQDYMCHFCSKEKLGLGIRIREEVGALQPQLNISTTGFEPLEIDVRQQVTSPWRWTRCISSAGAPAGPVFLVWYLSLFDGAVITSFGHEDH